MLSNNFYLYITRILSALCLFVLLPEANVWLNTLDNTILVLGYRLFIVFTPFIFLTFKHQVSLAAFIVAEVGLLAWLFQFNFIGTILIATGLSISGYMLKYYSTLTAHGAAGNKIALNLGSIFSGVMLIFFHQKLIIICICLGLVLLALLSFLHYYHHEKLVNYPSSSNDFSLKTLLTTKGIAWALIGFVIGVKLIAIFTVLPQFLLERSTHLPSWYGGMLILNCVIILIFQIPIMNKIKHWNIYKALIPLIASSLLVLCAPAFHLYSIVTASIWITALSVIECAVSFLDKLSRDDGNLLIKESAVGLGSAATVLGIRGLSPTNGSILIGITAIILIFISIVLLKLNESKSDAPKFI